METTTMTMEEAYRQGQGDAEDGIGPAFPYMGALWDAYIGGYESVPATQDTTSEMLVEDYNVQ